MNTFIIICISVFTLAVVAAVVYLILTLIQIRRTARQVELLLRSVNHDVNTIGRITGNISSLVEHLTFPWVWAGSWVAGIVSVLMGGRPKARHAVPEKEEKFNIEVGR